MRNILKYAKKTLLTVTMLTALISNANEKIAIEKKGLVKTALTINNVKEGNLLSIKDVHGITLYKELISKSGTYRKGFDLTALPDGEYVFEVDKDLQIKTIPFTVSNNNVVFNKTKEVTEFKPFVKKQNNLVYITQLAPNYETLDISIYANYDGEFQLIHSDKVENTQAIEKAYQLEKGSYKIVLHSNNKEYTKFINN
ncbi:hypothetical protein ACFFU1_00980 [Algibacter miyuki]|uniref:Por secretion system C-terminal sorting domain-containing protein n=1 Tax=Algibacter miyuki TaxID=1306933 RepID=A0ABV5GV07_9FLAO|nr:hypothetical protein [Algibacter miyuki]MDN3664783.1 hypothetical protein [Algibacter miyuki]